MNGLNRRAGGLSVILALAFSVGLSVAGETGDPQKGKMVFERNCQTCHGQYGRGDGPAGKLSSPPAADLTAVATQKKSDQDFVKFITNGKPPTVMPAFKGALNEQMIQDVLAYIRQLSRQDR